MNMWTLCIIRRPLNEGDIIYYKTYMYLTLCNIGFPIL